MIDNVLDVATNLSWFGDIYAAEIFYNCKMLESLQPYEGVDVYWVEKGDALHWGRWTSMTTGLVSSPFAAKISFS